MLNYLINFTANAKPFPYQIHIKRKIRPLMDVRFFSSGYGVAKYCGAIASNVTLRKFLSSGILIIITREEDREERVLTG